MTSTSPCELLNALIISSKRPLSSPESPVQTLILTPAAAPPATLRTRTAATSTAHRIRIAASFASACPVEAPARAPPDREPHSAVQGETFQMPCRSPRSGRYGRDDGRNGGRPSELGHWVAER